MTEEFSLMVTFGLLGLTILAVWLPPIASGMRFGMPVWPVLFCAAIVSGMTSGYLAWPALAALAGFAALAWWTAHSEASRWQRVVLCILTAVIALALALHRFPGFRNPVVIADLKVSAQALPFTQYANFDKAAVGLILLAWLCHRATSVDDWKEIARKTPLIIAITTVIVMGLAVALGVVRFDPKWPAITPVFLAMNLLFTCVAEEAFFRGFLQERCAVALQSVRWGGVITIALSGLLFGLAHAAGGVPYMILATVAGFGYATAYASVRRVEVAIATHIVVNAVHFIGFTYPQIA
ncbi:CPBP family intramembrane glutamic endopeptidase [Actimicrobium sp. CCI2.3]|uniref:CPBP family intramembrane glutamic endopeptidase n=1 Tax=Actimicrobium sp. CCI2.3 TaxID=3048616 RepID=UPI002AB455F9|nr:CPBP family intramembrane glutamic endopeptidase [Actimicrobium sp. CCI2.3]MDY7574416.1 CPBP family intramembrane glutamic endopeptidase [Actimicrobium sp. CCI2.3]MEB0022506.1 CPBP family intramembrane metalloprotease [Actimicrobium sp. CCI2.3]